MNFIRVKTYSLGDTYVNVNRISLIIKKSDTEYIIRVEAMNGTISDFTAYDYHDVERFLGLYDIGGYI